MTENKALSDSLDFVAVVFEPLMAICQNAKVKAVVQKDRAQIAKVLIEEQKAEVMEIIEAFDTADNKHIEYNGVTLFVRLMEILGKYGEDLMPFFRSQGQTMAEGSSGSLMESTAVEEK